MKRLISASAAALVASGMAISLAPSASAADCGQPAQDAIYKTVPGTEAVYTSIKVIDKKVTPGEPGRDAITHIEYGAQERTRVLVPGHAETFTTVYSYQRPAYKTQYHFSKFTQTRTRTAAQPSKWWVWAPTDTYGPQDYTPVFPEDERGKWVGPKTEGGPGQDETGVFQQGNGNSSWFYREASVAAGEWSEYGDWTEWTPETHTSWENTDEPLGDPQFHGSGTYDDGTQWERVWQARFDGDTRQVEDGVEYSGEVTETRDAPWVLVEGYPKDVSNNDATEDSYTDWSQWETTASGLLEEPVLPENTDTHEYRLLPPVTVTDVEATDPIPGTPEESHTRTVLVKPATKDSTVLISEATDATEICASPARLAQTGSNPLLPVGLGVGLLVLGAGAVAASRKTAKD